MTRPAGTRATVRSDAGMLHVLRGESIEGALTACGRRLKGYRSGGYVSMEHEGVTCRRCPKASTEAAERGSWDKPVFETVYVRDAYVRCSMPKPGVRAIAASDTCQQSAHTVVVEQDGRQMYRCWEHEGQRADGTTGPISVRVRRQVR